MASKAELKKREKYKALVPRFHEVQNKGNHSSKIRTDYDQQLWPVPGMKKHDTRRTSDA